MRLLKMRPKKIEENYGRLVAECKEQLTITAILKMPETCKHLQEIIAIKKDLLTLKCGCVFRLNNVLKQIPIP